MPRTSITRLPGAVARRKIETATFAVIAAGAALGMTNRGTPAAPPAVSAVLAREARAVTKPFTAALTPKVTVASAKTAKASLPVINHPRVDSWVQKFTTAQRGSMATYLSRMDRYDDMISSKLAANGLPQELIYLAMIESGFNPKAKSPVKASGLWQFMAGTAKQFGLTVNRKVDERNNPARATDAALAYLSQLYNRFGSWYLAAAAYNSGPGTVSKALKRVTGKTRGTDADFYRISARLPRETRDYVPKLIAAAKIGNNPERYGFAD
jgi:membrane-bound lytic murein transglycosylase D